jgi:hypothetical protein
LGCGAFFIIPTVGINFVIRRLPRVRDAALQAACLTRTDDKRQHVVAMFAPTAIVLAERAQHRFLPMSAVDRAA